MVKLYNLIKFAPILLILTSTEWNGQSKTLGSNVSASSPNFKAKITNVDYYSIATFTDTDSNEIKARSLTYNGELSPESGPVTVLRHSSPDAVFSNPDIERFRDQVIVTAQAKLGLDNSEIWISSYDSTLQTVVWPGTSLISDSNSDLSEPHVITLYNDDGEFANQVVIYKEQPVNDRSIVRIKAVVLDPDGLPIPNSFFTIANERDGIGELKISTDSQLAAISWESRRDPDKNIYCTLIKLINATPGETQIGLYDTFAQYTDGLLAFEMSRDQTDCRIALINNFMVVEAFDNGDILVKSIDIDRPEEGQITTIDHATNFTEFNIYNNSDGFLYIAAIKGTELLVFKFEPLTGRHRWVTGNDPGIVVIAGNDRISNPQIFKNGVNEPTRTYVTWIKEINTQIIIESDEITVNKELWGQGLNKDGQMQCSSSGVKITDNPLNYYIGYASGLDLITISHTSDGKITGDVFTDDCTKFKPDKPIFSGTFDIAAGTITLRFTISTTIANEIEIFKSVNTSAYGAPIIIPITQTIYVDSNITTPNNNYKYYARTRTSNPIARSDETYTVNFNYVNDPDKLAGHDFTMMVNNTSTQGVILTWQDNSTNESSFRIERSINSGNFAEIAITGSNICSYFDPQRRDPGETRKYRVRAVYTYINNNSYSKYSNEITINNSGSDFPNTAPIMKQPTQSNGTVSLTWTDTSGSSPNHPNEDSFRLERAVSGSQLNFSELQPLAARDSTSYTDSNTTLNTTYAYRMYSNYGPQKSSYTSIFNVTTFSGSGPPAAPSNLAGTYLNSPSPIKVALNWRDNANNETGFSIERKEEGQNFAEIRRLSTPNLTTFDDTAVQPDKVYIYRIRTFNTVGNSGYSNEVVVSTSNSGGGTNIPNSPSNLTAVFSKLNRSITLDWVDNSTNELGFSVERREDISPMPTFIEIYRTNLPDIIQWKDTNVLNNSKYTYKVRAYNNSGNSGYTNEVTIATDPPTIIPDPFPLPPDNKQTPKSGKKKSQSACFIATASSASPQSALPATLSRFRNNCFYRNVFTLTGIKSYAELSPQIAKSISQSTTLQAISENLLGIIPIICASIGIFIISFLLIKLKRF
ncbi:MAG: fibronectin type III domain-containing protein [Planctomycetes bacterium]|nr:fibronectin type III domain-containing protein [Planctomycetota bacterium]